MRALLYLVPLALTIYAFIDCLNTPEKEAKHLPKTAWVIIILLFWVVGPVVWLVAGKLRRGGATLSERARGRRTQWVAPDDNPDFLKSLRDESRDGSAGGKTARKPAEADPARGEDEPKHRDGTVGPDETQPPAPS
ncbi:hypothetical protein EES43_11905 [Streptomyces sp. ADI96-02]|uniref:PLD nuclease N-terminal domain-containing protein n=1 Tax=unclassified Streptomyces TaxID=2593676 RepID=UPI000F55777F|nr:PLD nuclease N-terminal domain-containing protein [Streptomyces sp. ADI96-02]RPK63230.1 hypothetical protein EES43_11905 [Streptomyces sp. ADI96-02]